MPSDPEDDGAAEEAYELELERESEKLLAEVTEAANRPIDVTNYRARARLYARRSADPVGATLKARRRQSRDGFGALLKSARELRALDPMSLATDAKIDPKAVALLEDGSMFPTTDVVLVLALLLRRPENGDDSAARELEAKFRELLGDLVLPAHPAKARQKQIERLIETGETDREQRGEVPRAELLAQRDGLRRNLEHVRSRMSRDRVAFGYPAL